MRLVDLHRIPNPRFAILTSYRSVVSPLQNNARFEDLKKILTSYKFYVVKILGRWRGVLEPALLIYGINLKLVTELGKRYNQDAVIYSGPETGNEAYLIYRNGTWKRFRTAYEVG